MGKSGKTAGRGKKMTATPRRGGAKRSQKMSGKPSRKNPKTVVATT